MKTLILEGSEASYWIGFGDGRDAVQQLFPDLDLSSIVVPGAEEEEEGGADGSLAGPTGDDAPITIPAPSESAVLVIPATLSEGAADPPAPMDSASELIAEVLTEIQDAAPTDAVPPTDAAPTTEAQNTPDSPSE